MTVVAEDQVAPSSAATALTRAAQTMQRVWTVRRSNIALAFLLCAVLPPLTAHAMPRLFSQTSAYTLCEAAAFAAAALSLNLLTGYAGQISLGHAALLGVGAFGTGMVCGRLGWPMWAGIPVGGAAAGVVALLVGFPALRLRGLYLALATIGFGYAMENSILQWDRISQGSSGLPVPRNLGNGSIMVNYGDFLAVALVVVLLLWLLDDNVTRTRLGRALHAIRENESVAQSFGIGVWRHKLVAFVLSGVMAGVAGSLLGLTVGFAQSDTFSDSLSLQLVIIVVVGGLGSRVGVVASALAFTVLPDLLSSALHTDLLVGLRFAVGAALLMVTVARHPGGVAELWRQLSERRRVRAEIAAADGVDEDSVPPLPELPLPAGMAERAPVAGPLLQARDIVVRFGGLVAVDGASIAVPQGRIVGLIGPNGAGKTTLFNAVTGHVPVESGQISLRGEALQHLPTHVRAARGLSRSFQQVGLVRSLSVLDNMLLAQNLLAGYGDAAGLVYTPGTARSEAEMRRRAESALRALGFEHFADLAVGNLSGGQQRIVEIACLLLVAPDVLMLDEPSAGMAPGAVENLAVRLRDIRDRMGQTVLLIEHNIPLVLDVCDEVYVLNAGRVIADGAPADVVRDPEVVSAYLGEAAA